jgi:hypothetical protein
MKRRDLNAALAAADPVDRESLDRLEFETMEDELLADIAVSGAPAPEPGHGKRERRRPRWGFSIALGGLAAAAAAAIVLLLGTGASQSSSKAYAAELIRFAESTPLLLLEGPGWRVQNANEELRRKGTEGMMDFVAGKPMPYDSIRITGTPNAQRAVGMSPPAVRQRRVELRWRRESLAKAISLQRASPHPHGQRWVELPVLGTTAQVDTRAELFVNQGGPGNRQMVAFWVEDGYVLTLRAAVPDQAAFEERLDWLTKVDSETWLDAMPAKVVKAADHDAAVREMLKGIPLPSTFKPSRVPDTGLTTDRYLVGGAVTSTVSCLWFLQWAEARRTGDRAAAAEAEQAMASSKHWAILREMAKEGAFPETIWELARQMPKGYWEWNGHRHPLLPRAESLGCARLGIPLLPRKQKLQRERGPPLPPR